MRLGPVGFLLMVPLVWTGVRAVMLWPGADERAVKTIARAAPLQRPAVQQPAAREIAAIVRARGGGWSTSKSAGAHRSRAPRLAPDKRVVEAFAERSGAVSSSHPPSPGRPLPLPVAPDPASPPTPRNNRFSLSAWLLARGDVAPGLAAAGQLGGSQAGLRARYAVSQHIHLAARLSGPLQARRGKEAALGLDVRPIVSVPITVTLERRIGLDRGGRNAFALGAFGGFDQQVARGLRLDGYAQAGLVGIRRRDAYVDGALRIAHDVIGPVAAGAGLWGGAQPGAARLDVGPQLVLRTGGLRLGAEWRQRVAGGARPNSGPVLSLGADF